MKAVLADLSTPRYLWTAAAGKVKSDAGWGPGGLMRLADVPEPSLPKADGWVRIKPELSGICGSDVGLAHAKSSFVMSAFYAEPKAIPGHELVGVVTDGSLEGQRVVLDPIISCVHRGFEPCRTCREGRPYACERFDEAGITGCHAPGQGFSDAVGGGWGRAWSRTSRSASRSEMCHRSGPSWLSPHRSGCTPPCSGSAPATGWW